MITQRDLQWVSKLAPVAQLLEMLGGLDQPSVRSGEVFQAMARDVWEAYWYLSARMNDELVGLAQDARGDEYFEAVERRARKAVDW